MLVLVNMIYEDKDMTLVNPIATDNCMNVSDFIWLDSVMEQFTTY
jgi:hypothetical protein